MRAIKFLIIVVAATLTVTSCDWVRAKLGMPTSADLNEAQRAYQESEAARRISDSIAQAKRDSTARVADSLSTAQESQKDLATKKFDPNAAKRFHVIVGSFKDHSNTARFVKKLEAQGYTPVVFNFKNGFEALSASSFDNISSAFNQMYKLMDDGYAPEDVWVYDTKQNLHN